MTNEVFKLDNVTAQNISKHFGARNPSQLYLPGLEPFGPGSYLVVIEHVVQAQHSFQVVHGGEFRREAAPDELGR